MPATQRKCIYRGLTLDVDRHYIESVIATTHQEKGIITLESNPSREKFKFFDFYTSRSEYNPCGLCYVDNTTVAWIGKVLPVKTATYTSWMTEDQNTDILVDPNIYAIGTFVTHYVLIYFLLACVCVMTMSLLWISSPFFCSTFQRG